jgi:hypothetical protein
MQEESFDYEDVVHVTATAGKSIFYLILGVLLALSCLTGLIIMITEGSENGQAILGAILGIFIGIYLIVLFFIGRNSAVVMIDFTKDKEVGSFQQSLLSWGTVMNPFSLISNKPRRHVTRVLVFDKQDAFAATSKICAIRQALKEKLASV